MRNGFKAAAAAFAAMTGAAAAEKIDNIVVTAKTHDFRAVYAERAANSDKVLAKAARRAEFRLAHPGEADPIMVVARTYNFRPIYAERARNYETVLAAAAERAEMRIIAMTREFDAGALFAAAYQPVSFEVASN